VIRLVALTAPIPYCAIKDLYYYYLLIDTITMLIIGTNYRALGIPVSDYTYADCLLINKAQQLNIPSASDLIKVQKLRNKFG
jgi:hypothetical protein